MFEINRNFRTKASRFANPEFTMMEFMRVLNYQDVMAYTEQCCASGAPRRGDSAAELPGPRR